jgi:hypothetical protein
MRLAVLAAGYVEERDGEERIMFPWYVDVALVLVVFACFRGVWSCSTPSGFPTHRLHPAELDKSKAGTGD